MSYEKIKPRRVTQRFPGIFRPAASVLLCSILLSASIFSSGLAQAACAHTTDASKGTDTQTVTIPSTGTYFIWSRLLAPDTTNNSYYLQIDGGCAVNVGDSPNIPANTWTWVDYQDGNASTVTSVSLTAGSHQIVMTGREPGVGVDRVLFLGSQACTPPLGNGDNCTPVVDNPPTVSLTAPASGATVSGSNVSLSANATDDHAVSSVAFTVDGTSAGTDTSFPYTVSWNSTTVSDASHTLVATATDSAGHKTTAQETITVANHTCANGPSKPSLSGHGSSLTQTALSWTASTAASGCSISNYDVYRANTKIGTVSTTSFNDSGLTPNTTYTYHVIANDNGGHSATSSNVNVATLADTTPPSAPGNVKAIAPNPNEVDLSWSTSTDNVAVAGYRIYRNSTLVATVNGVDTTTYKDTTNVAANTAYHYQVAAIDTSNNASASVIATPDPITTPPIKVTTPPSAPGNLHTTLITSTSVVLAWNASTDTSGTLAGYHVYRNGSQVGTVISGTGYTDSQLNASTTYQYSVKAYDTAGNVSTGNPTISATTQPGTTSFTPGDINHDHIVNYLDAAILFSHWGQTNATAVQGNINGDSSVNYLDAAILFSHWGQS